MGDAYKAALEYIYDLVHEVKLWNPAPLDKDFCGPMNDYLVDKVASMRQWPNFNDVSHSPVNATSFKKEKAAAALPPVGPGGKANPGQTASRGFGLVKTAPNLDAAKEVIKFLVSPKTVAEMALTSYWHVSARKSVLATVGDKGIAKLMKMYSDGGFIGVWPFHPRVLEALTILEDTATASLTAKIKLYESLKQARDRLAQLGSFTLDDRALVGPGTFLKHPVSDVSAGDDGCFAVCRTSNSLNCILTSRHTRVENARYQTSGQKYDQSGKTR